MKHLDYKITSGLWAIYQTSNQTSNQRTTTFKSLTQKDMKYYQHSLTDLLSAYWRVCTRCKLKCLKNCELEEWLLQKEVDESKKSRTVNWEFSFQYEKSRRGQFRDGSFDQRKKRKGKTKMSKTTPREETTSVGPRKTNVHMEKTHLFKYVPNKKAKGRDDFVLLLRQVHYTEIRKVTKKTATTETHKTHHDLLMKVRQRTRTDYLAQFSRKEVVTWEFM